MRAHEFLREDIENFPIANVRRPNGAIGNQGVNTEQAADVLTHAAGMQVSPDMTMRQLVDALKADPAAQQRLRQFVQKNPVTVSALPDGSYHLLDGHHRTFLLNLLGDETVPAVVKEDAVQETFLGEYPSLETTLGEASHSDLVKYDKKQEKQLHRNLDISKGTGKDFSPDYDSDEKDWSDLDHAMDYTGGSRDTNDYLHRQYRKQAKAKELSQHQAKIQALDRLLANHQLPEQIIVYTGLKESPADAWKKYKADVSKPIRLHLPAYTSTTTKLKIALQHVADEVAQVSRKTHQPRNKDAPKEEWGSQILMITLPKGMPAASVKKVSEYPGENEILLPRGMDIEINPNPTVLKNGDCVWHTQVLGHNPVQIAAPVQENFADGKGPGRPGDSQRHGIPKHATMTELEKASHADGRKGQLARWQLNMRRGHKK